jgi:saccharopine dehydrogenase (NAD+, L-lysine-forming)
MARVLVIGCGNVGSAGLHKMAQMPEVFSQIHVVSRSREKAEKVRTSIYRKTNGRFNVVFHQEDVSKFDSIREIIEFAKPDLVIHWGHPYENLILMGACLDSGVDYIDTACYEDPDRYGFSHRLQWTLGRFFQEKNLLALLGCGFDPGVTNVFSAFARDYLFDEVHSVDILDCNGGTKDASIKFAPNFNPELNLRELILPVKFWQKGKWQERGRIFDDDAIHFNFNFPETGEFSPYLMYHEEMESLVKHMPHLKRIRFWMTFSKEYLTYLRVLYNVGLTRIDPVMYEGRSVIPVKFLDELLPKGKDFNKTYTGKTCIGNIISGLKDGKKKVIFIYNVCDHREAFWETGGNAIGYTTAIPTVVAAKLILESKWGKGVVGVKNMEDSAFDSMVFLEELARLGLPWKVKKLKEIPKFLQKDF